MSEIKEIVEELKNIHDGNARLRNKIYAEFEIARK
jgi:hypothetical protein